MKNTWTVEEFTPEQIDKNLNENKSFVVPRYQRGIVWKDSQRAELVDTIKLGLPFGSLLLFKDPDGKYQIIDGLQRSNAIVSFVKTPTQFFDEADIDVSVIRKIVELIGANGNISAMEEKVKDMLVFWVKEEHKSLSDVMSMQFSKFGQIISKEFSSCRGKEFEIGDLIEPMMKHYQDICSTISGTKIPAIVLMGDSENLPILFERINSKGTQLSKYQIFAATWSGNKYKIDNEHLDIVKANRERYDQMLEGTGSIDDYDAVSYLNERELDAFEIAFGFGKMLCNRYPHLFGKSAEANKVESVGFTIMAGCLGLKNKQAKYMNIKLDSMIGEEYINQFLSKILDAVKIVDKQIGKYNKFKANKRTNAGKRPLHTEFQISAIIISVFIMKYAKIDRDKDDNIISITYNLDTPNREWKKNYQKKFKQNVSKRYIQEILQKRWSGTGDKKLDSVLITPAMYTKEVTISDFEHTLDNWFENLNEERQEFKRIATPKEPELIFLAALYISIFTARQQVDESNYDIEHLATQNLMKKTFG